MDAEHATRRDVRETYERIGSHFAETRAHPWPAVERFIENTGAHTIGLDLGCGNARHAALLAEHADRVLAIDASHTVLETARERCQALPIERCQADATALPILTHAIDCAVYIATIHHLPSRKARIESLDELGRVLSPGGTALVSAWSVTHDRFSREKGFDTTIDWTLPDGEVVPRYYHIYDPAEFESDMRESKLIAERVFEESGNCYAEVTPD